MNEQNGSIRPASREPETIEKLLRVWDSAVRSTHAFLSEEDIRAIRPEVAEGLREISALYCYFENDEPQGFIGVAEASIEMLFVDAEAQGKGIGRKLIERVWADSTASSGTPVTSVDVNEQNPQALAFYEHLGFKVTGRYALDDAGRPFPILHLSLAK